MRACVCVCVSVIIQTTVQGRTIDRYITKKCIDRKSVVSPLNHLLSP